MDSERSLREHGLRIGELEPGPTGSIADVDGVAVGHVTVVRDEPDPPEGRGVARSGVTAVVPGPVERLLGRALSAGTAVLNGAGELTSSVEIMEWGLLSTPVYLTATMSVGRVFDGAVATAIASDPGLGVDHVVIPTVGECDDSWLNDARVVQVEADDAGRAVADAASSPEVVEGAVGAGTGMICCDWKGGIGSSSRITEEGHVVGVLVLANYGVRSDLRVDGVPVGRLLEGPAVAAGRRAAASPWWRPTPSSGRRSSRASRAGPGSAWAEPGPWRITGAARSSSPSRPRRARCAARPGPRGSPRTGSTRSSRPPSRRPRRP